MCPHTLRPNLPADRAGKEASGRPASAGAGHEPPEPAAPPAPLCGDRLPRARTRSWRRGLIGLLSAAGLSVFMVALTPATTLSAPTWLPTGCEVKTFTFSAGTGSAEGRWRPACRSLFTYLRNLSVSDPETGYAHFYELELTAAAEITVRLTEHDTSHHYVLRTATGDIVTQVMYAYDFSPAECASIGLVCRSPSRLYATLAAGTYYLELIQHFSQDGRQRSYKALVETHTDDDFPAATSTTGTVATDGTAVNGEVRFAGDEDWFKVTLEAEEWYRIDVKRSGTGAGSLRDPRLLGIHTSAGTRLADTADDNSGADNNSLLFFEGPDDGVHYVAVGGSNSAVGTYTLSVTKEDEAVRVVTNRAQLTVDEGTTATYRLQPQGGQWNRLTVEIDVPAGSSLSVQPETVTFTRTDQVGWQTIRVTADRDANWADETVTITHSVQGNGSIATDDVAVTVRDSGPPSIRLLRENRTLTGSLSLVEGGQDTYQLRLWSAPVGPVTVQIHAPAKLSVVPASLDFDASSWSRPRTVTVTALHDDADIFDEVLLVRHRVTRGSDTGPVNQLEVTVTDDDNEEDLVGPRPAGTVWWASLRAQRGVQYVGHINYTGPRDTGELSNAAFTYDGIGREIDAAFVDDSGHFQLWVDSGNGVALPNSLVLHVGAASMELGSATRQSFKTTYNDGREPTFRAHAYWWAAGTHTVSLSNGEVVAVWLEEGTGARDLPGVPDALEGRALDGGVELRWEAVAENPAQPVLYYEYTQEGTEGWTRTVGAETSKEAANLTNGESYTFRVRAVNAAGKGAASAASAPVTPRASSGQNQGEGGAPPPGGGGGGGGGDGGSVQDRHGDSARQATAVLPGVSAPWASSTAGQLNPATDVDYFTLDVPRAGLLVVETIGSTDTLGTVWQAGVELARADSGGAGQNFQLSVPVQAGPVVMAVAGRGQTGSYVLETRLVVGFLENPGPASFQSGIGVVSGWVCAADVVEIELNGVPQVAAYGTERGDTAGVCGDTDNGFGLLFNWNLLGDGEHEVVAVVDGTELARATVRVTTLGEEFVRGAAGECVVADFPAPGETVTLEWQQSQQNFVVTEVE